MNMRDFTQHTIVYLAHSNKQAPYRHATIAYVIVENLRYTTNYFQSVQSLGS